MKKYAFRIVVILLTVCVLTGINACKKTNTTPPVITVIGPPTIHISLNSTYTDQGASAADVEDGADAVNSDYSVTNPNVDLVGTYTIHYTSYDNEGNISTATRTVIVSNDAQKVAGMYSVVDVIAGKNSGSYAYITTVTVSPTVNDQVFVNNFSGLGGAVTVVAEALGASIFLNPGTQTPSGMKDPGVIGGSGGAVINSGKIASFNYTITYNSSGSDHTTSSLWTKQ